MAWLGDKVAVLGYNIFLCISSTHINGMNDGKGVSGNRWIGLGRVYLPSKTSLAYSFKQDSLEIN